MLSRIGPRKKPWNRKPQFEVGVSAAEAGPVAGPATAVVWGDSPSWVVFPRRLGCGLVVSASGATTAASGRALAAVAAGAGAPAAGEGSSSSAAGEPAWANVVLPKANRVATASTTDSEPRKTRMRGGALVAMAGRARRTIRTRGVVWHISDVHHIIPNCCFRQVATVRSQVGTSPISKVVDELCNKVGDPQSIDQLIEMSGTPSSGQADS